jgi:hypothetical protein
MNQLAILNIWLKVKNLRKKRKNKLLSFLILTIAQLMFLRIYFTKEFKEKEEMKNQRSNSYLKIYKKCFRKLT